MKAKLFFQLTLDFLKVCNRLVTMHGSGSHLLYNLSARLIYIGRSTILIRKARRPSGRIYTI